MNKKRENKKAQVTIFIIIAIVIALILLIVFYSDIEIFFSGSEPVAEIQGCMKNAVSEALKNITSQGGVLEPENYYLYQGEKIEYACYTNEYYKACVMQKPFLKQEIEQELEDYAEPRVRQCLLNLKTDLENRGLRADFDFKGLNVEIIPERIAIEADANLVVTKEDAVRYKKIKTDLYSGLYNMLMISSSILNWEARYGESDPVSFMVFYPDIKVEKQKQSDGTKIYILSDRTTLESFQFASRSFVLPPGYFG